MNATSLGDFIVNQLLGGKQKKWDMAPNSFDFEITHDETNLTTDRVKALITFLWGKESFKLRIDEYVTGTVVLPDGCEYLFSVSNWPQYGIIRGTLIKQS
ncbi:MAG: hypothetical protein KBC33_01725 [Candidatus Pacebacteria bacterium]|nr:hypothetical protein [Candidatus Paceibacterota bacterium]